MRGHPEQPSPKQTYRKAPFASAEERKFERRKIVRICGWMDGWMDAHFGPWA
jgi:hypothetical protein